MSITTLSFKVKEGSRGLRTSTSAVWRRIVLLESTYNEVDVGGEVNARALGLSVDAGATVSP